MTTATYELSAKCLKNICKLMSSLCFIAGLYLSGVTNSVYSFSQDDSYKLWICYLPTHRGSYNLTVVDS